MAKASDNLFPYVHLVPAAAPSSPAAGAERIYLDSADSNKLKRKDSAGTVTLIEGGAGGLTAVTEVTTPSSPASGTQTLFLDSADHKLKRVDSSGAVTSIEGGSSSTIKDRRWAAAAGATVIDEFNDSSLAAGFARVDGTGAVSGNAVWTEDADSVSLALAGGDTAVNKHGLVIPLSGFGGSIVTGDAITSHITHYTLTSGNSVYAVGGVVLADGNTYGAGKQICGAVFLNTGTSAVELQTQTHASTNWTTAGTDSTLMPVPRMPQHVRLVYLGSNTWRTDLSPDGVSWIKGPTTTHTLTPTHVGLWGSSWGTSIRSVLSFDYLRRTSGVS